MVVILVWPRVGWWWDRLLLAEMVLVLLLMLQIVLLMVLLLLMWLMLFLVVMMLVLHGVELMVEMLDGCGCGGGGGVSCGNINNMPNTMRSQRGEWMEAENYIR